MQLVAGWFSVSQNITGEMLRKYVQIKIINRHSDGQLTCNITQFYHF